MLVREIVLRENYNDDLLIAVQDILVSAASKNIKEIPTERFRAILAKQGYNSSIDEIIMAVDQSGYASSVDKEKIVPLNQLSADIDTDAEPSVDVGKMAGDQALGDVKSGL
jgi:hypothetical protein